MQALATNVLQLGMLGLGVSLLLLWINYLKAHHERNASHVSDDSSSEARVASATRSRTGP